MSGQANHRVAKIRSFNRLSPLALLGAVALAIMLTSCPGASAEEPSQQVTIAHGIATFDDLQLPADFEHLAYVNPDAPKGGEISESWVGGFDTMNPFSIQGRAAIGSPMMLESILTETADEIGASYCLLCETLEYPEDRRWVIFNLRPEAAFSDGSPLTAEDVVFSYETFRDKGLSDFRAVFSQNVAEAEILGPHRVRFTFTDTAPLHEMPQSVGSLPIFSKAQFERENRDLEEASLTPFIGSGPYVADKVDPGRSVSYRRNPDYWGANLPINRGRNNFDRIRYEYFAEPNAAFEAFKAGLYTFRVENTSKIWAEQYDFNAVKSGHVIRETLPSGVKASGQSSVFNLRRADWQDIRVREAISLMFNFEWTNSKLFYNLYERVNSFWENSWLEAEGIPTEAEIAILQPLVDQRLLPESILTDEAVMAPVSNPDRQLDRRNQRRAAQLLEEAGWMPGKDGLLRNHEGRTLELEILEDNPQFERVLAPFVENLRSLGIDARLNLIDSAQYEVRVRNPAYDFDLTTSFTRTDYLSGSELKQFYGSATSDISAFNAAGLKSPAVDRLIDVVLAANSRDELTVATKALDRVLRSLQFRIPQWYNANYWVAYYDMYDHPAELPPYALGETDFWWYDADKAAKLTAAGVLK